MFRKILMAAATMLLLANYGLGQPGKNSRADVVKIAERIRKADYEGDRAALSRLYTDLMPFVSKSDIASRVRYWRGFALWRRAINGFNESATPSDLQDDLERAASEFKESSEMDSAFMDAKIGAASCLSNLVFLNRKDPARVQELLGQVRPLLRQAKDADPDNPRLAWVIGPNLWYAPPEMGGSQAKAIEVYEHGLAAARSRKGPPADSLDPSWGEPELLMNLAWSNLNRTEPDLKAADSYAKSALNLVPYWHYMRDILIPQIQDAQSKKLTVPAH
jgi:hypothetical protein